MSASVERIIKSEQPFNNTTPDDTLFFALDELSVRDKHRLLVLLVAIARVGQRITVRSKPVISNERDGVKNPEIVGMSIPKFGRVTREGAVVASCRFKEPAPEFEAETDFVPYVVFDKVRRTSLRPVTEMLSFLVAPAKRLLHLFAAEV